MKVNLTEEEKQEIMRRNYNTEKAEYSKTYKTA